MSTVLGTLVDNRCLHLTATTQEDPRSNKLPALFCHLSAVPLKQLLKVLRHLEWFQKNTVSTPTESGCCHPGAQLAVPAAQRCVNSSVPNAGSTCHPWGMSRSDMRGCLSQNWGVVLTFSKQSQGSCISQQVTAQPQTPVAPR